MHTYNLISEHSVKPWHLHSFMTFEFKQLFPDTSRVRQTDASTAVPEMDGIVSWWKLRPFSGHYCWQCARLTDEVINQNSKHNEKNGHTRGHRRLRQVTAINRSSAVPNPWVNVNLTAKEIINSQEEEGPTASTFLGITLLLKRLKDCSKWECHLLRGGVIKGEVIYSIFDRSLFRC